LVIVRRLIAMVATLAVACCAACSGSQTARLGESLAVLET
jgi:hypothetical protein